MADTVAVVVAGAGELTGTGQFSISRGGVLAVPFGFGDWAVSGDTRVLVCRPGDGWPATFATLQTIRLSSASERLTLKQHAFVPTDRAVVEDLRERLARFRRVSDFALDRPLGTDSHLLDELEQHWRSDYDWFTHEHRIAGHPWVETDTTPVPIRAIVSRRPDPSPAVLLLHGWPDSVLRFEKILPNLQRDVSYVLPALPGFPFSAPVDQGGLSSIQIADAVADAMVEFGFDRYVISAGDVGCDVAEALAARHHDAVAALHLTDISQYHFLVNPPTDLTEQERAYMAYGHHWQATEGGYMHEQATRPNTLAVGLGDSPAGLAAWITEKLVRWTDSNDHLANAFTNDEALTWISAYWMTGTIGTSFAPYAAGGAKDWPPITAPSVFTVFAKDLVNAPKSFADKFFNVVEWREYEQGGHFAAWERPEDYLWGLRRALKIR